VAGLQEAGVAACAKHFPGHGATSEDSHLGLPTVDVPLDVLRARDLRPFAAAVAAGVRSVMTAHVRVPALTGDLPATLSRAALQTLLRGELGFDGVVVTDALDMGGASGPRGVPAAAAEAFAAGADLLCLGPAPGPEAIAATVAAVAEAVRARRVPATRLDAAAARIATLTTRSHPARPGSTPGFPDGAHNGAPGMTAPGGAAADAEVRDGAPGVTAPGEGAQGRAATGWAGFGDGPGMEAARAALRVDGAVPVLRRPLVVQLEAPATIAAGSVPWGMAPWLPDAHAGGEAVAVDRDGVEPAGLLARAEGRSLVVVVRDAHRHPWMVQVVEALVAARPDAVVIEMGLPLWRPAHPGAYLATYGAAQANAAAAVEVLA
jgi:beta-N-acetylhexosaminidase